MLRVPLLCEVPNSVPSEKAIETFLNFKIYDLLFAAYIKFYLKYFCYLGEIVLYQEPHVVIFMRGSACSFNWKYLFPQNDSMAKWKVKKLLKIILIKVCKAFCLYSTPGYCVYTHIQHPLLCAYLQTLSQQTIVCLFKIVCWTLQ